MALECMLQTRRFDAARGGILPAQQKRPPFQTAPFSLVMHSLLVVSRRIDLDVVHLERCGRRPLEIGDRFVIVRLRTYFGVSRVGQGVLTLEQKKCRRAARIKQSSFAL